VEAEKSLLKHFVVFAPKTFSISTTCLLWREAFAIIYPVLKHGAWSLAIFDSKGLRQ
jgi:hypothetical protein